MRNNGSGDLPGLFADLIQIYSDNTATSLKFNAFVSYVVHVV